MQADIQIKFNDIDHVINILKNILIGKILLIVSKNLIV